MAQRIKGITIELDGETKGLDKALADVNKRSRELQKELRDVERLLKFDPGNAEALAQKQQILNQEIENTTERLKRLQAVEGQVEQQFKSGKIGENQYRAFRREIQFTEKRLQNLQQEIAALDDTKAVDNVKTDLKQVQKEANDAKGAVSELGGAIAGIAAGGGIAGAVATALDSASLKTNIEISMDVPPESIGAVKNAVATVNSYIDDQAAAIEGVRRQWALNADASDEANARIVKGAAAIARAYYGIDFSELIQETNEISKSFGISNDEALGLVNALLKIGFPPEQLDIISEYGTQLRIAGYDAKEIQAIFAAGIDTGTWNIDNLLDGLKEGRIRLAEFGEEVPKAMEELLEGTNISAQQLQQWGRAVAAGGDAGKRAMQEVATALGNIKDETKQNAVGVAIYGTMWEDQGTAIIDTILGAKDQVVDLKANQDQLNDSVARLDQDPMVQLKQAMSDLKEAMGPLLSEIANFVSEVAKWIKENPKLAATIAAVVTGLGILLGIFLALSPIITAIAGLAGVLGVSFGAIAGPVLIVIGVIVALIAIGVLLYKNWDTIKAKAAEIWGKIKSTLAKKWEEMKTSAREKWEGLKETVRQKMQEAENKIREIMNKALNFLRNINLTQIGRNIIQGLLNGLASLKNKVLQKAQEIADGIKRRIKDALGIASPSKVMMEMGEDTVRGFEIGIRKRLDQLQRMSEEMAQAAIPQASVPSNRTSQPQQITTPVNVTLQFNRSVVFRNRSDMQELAQEVAQVLNQTNVLLDRAKGVVRFGSAQV
nr:replication protein [Staphylospora marina]